MKTLLRIVVIGAILLILVFLSIGIVKIVPKALSSLASATVSIGSLFGGNENASSTTATDVNGTNGVNIGGTTGVNGETIVPNGNGFIVVSSSTNPNVNGVNANKGNTSANSTTNKTATSTTLLDLIKPKFGSYPYNNYVPTPAGQSTSTKTSTTNNGGTQANASSNSVHTSSRTCTGSDQPDIAISILNRGVISKTTGQFIETNSFTTGDTVSIKFKVENRGLCSTGTWNFKAEMPSNNAVDQLRTVANVGSLPAGSAVTGQANFDSPRAGSSNVIFTVTDNGGRDGNTSNNVTTSALSVTNTGTGSNGGNGGNGSNGGNGGVITSGDGRADLAVRILQTGTLTYNNQFIPSNAPFGTANGYTNGGYGTNYSTAGNFRSSDRVAVQFEVVNQGLSASGAWNFRAELTDFPVKNYNNPQYEASIPAGGRTVYTIAFDNVRVGSDTITIFIDHLNQVNEYNEGNNTASVGFNVNY